MLNITQLSKLQPTLEGMSASTLHGAVQKWNARLQVAKQTIGDGKLGRAAADAAQGFLKIIVAAIKIWIRLDAAHARSHSVNKTLWKIFVSSIRVIRCLRPSGLTLCFQESDFKPYTTKIKEAEMAYIKAADAAPVVAADSSDPAVRAGLAHPAGGRVVVSGQRAIMTRAATAEDVEARKKSLEKARKQFNLVLNLCEATLLEVVDSVTTDHGLGPGAGGRQEGTLPAAQVWRWVATGVGLFTPPSEPEAAGTAEYDAETQALEALQIVHTLLISMGDVVRYREQCGIPNRRFPTHMGPRENARWLYRCCALLLPSGRISRVLNTEWLRVRDEHFHCMHTLLRCETTQFKPNRDIGEQLRSLADKNRLCWERVGEGSTAALYAPDPTNTFSVHEVPFVAPAIVQACMQYNLLPQEPPIAVQFRLGQSPFCRALLRCIGLIVSRLEMHQLPHIVDRTIAQLWNFIQSEGSVVAPVSSPATTATPDHTEGGFLQQVGPVAVRLHEGVVSEAELWEGMSGAEFTCFRAVEMVLAVLEVHIAQGDVTNRLCMLQLLLRLQTVFMTSMFSEHSPRLQLAAPALLILHWLTDHPEAVEEVRRAHSEDEAVTMKASRTANPSAAALCEFVQGPHILQEMYDQTAHTLNIVAGSTTAVYTECAEAMQRSLQSKLMHLARQDVRDSIVVPPPALQLVHVLSLASSLPEERALAGFTPCSTTATGRVDIAEGSAQQLWDWCVGAAENAGLDPDALDVTEMGGILAECSIAVDALRRSRLVLQGHLLAGALRESLQEQLIAAELVVPRQEGGAHGTVTEEVEGHDEGMDFDISPQLDDSCVKVLLSSKRTSILRVHPATGQFCAYGAAIEGDDSSDADSQHDDVDWGEAQSVESMGSSHTQGGGGDRDGASEGASGGSVHDAESIGSEGEFAVARPAARPLPVGGRIACAVCTKSEHKDVCGKCGANPVTGIVPGDEPLVEAHSTELRSILQDAVAEIELLRATNAYFEGPDRCGDATVDMTVLYTQAGAAPTANQPEATPKKLYKPPAQPKQTPTRPNGPAHEHGEGGGAENKRGGKIVVSAQMLQKSKKRTQNGGQRRSKAVTNEAAMVDNAAASPYPEHTDMTMAETGVAATPPPPPPSAPRQGKASKRGFTITYGGKGAAQARAAHFNAASSHQPLAQRLMQAAEERCDQTDQEQADKQANKGKRAKQTAPVAAAAAPTGPTGGMYGQCGSHRCLVVLDGSNIAMAAGQNSNFVVSGITRAVKWFQQRGHKVAVPLPAHLLDKGQVEEKRARLQAGKDVKASTVPDDVDTLVELQRRNVVFPTPSSDYDDSYCIKLALEKDGVVVSGDKYRDYAHAEFERGGRKRAEAARTWLAAHRLSFAFVAGRFIPKIEFVFPPPQNGQAVAAAASKPQPKSAASSVSDPPPSTSRHTPQPKPVPTSGWVRAVKQAAPRRPGTSGHGRFPPKPP